ncbi:hypothetical protein D3C79_828020 [compost metagenome]
MCFIMKFASSSERIASDALASSATIINSASAALQENPLWGLPSTKISPALKPSGYVGFKRCKNATGKGLCVAPRL